MEVARGFVVRKGVEGLNQSKQKPNGEVESSRASTVREFVGLGKDVR